MLDGTPLCHLRRSLGRRQRWHRRLVGRTNRYDGYIVIQGYLNFAAESHAFAVPGGSATVGLAILAAGLPDPLFEVSGAELDRASLSGTETTYEPGNCPGADRFDISITDSEESTCARTVSIVILEGAEAISFYLYLFCMDELQSVHKPIHVRGVPKC
jgi:hypothetical protein